MPDSSRGFLVHQLLAAVLIGFVSQIAGPPWLKSLFAINVSARVQFILILGFAFAISVLLHEIGHLLPAICFGFNISRIMLGPVSAVRLCGRWQLQYSGNWFSGAVSAMPLHERAWRSRMLIVVAGGPAITLCALLVSCYLVRTLKLGPHEAYFLSMLGQLNLFLFVLGLFPNSANAPVRNDARLFLVLLQNGLEAEQIKLYQIVTRLQVSGVRPAAYSRELIARIANATGNYDLMLFHALTVFGWALDSGELHLAQAWIFYANNLAEQHTLRLSDIVHAESACFDLLYQRNCASALDKLRGTNIKALKPWLQYRTRAVAQIAQGAYSDALMSIKNARAHLSALPTRSEFELTILDLLERQITSACLCRAAGEPNAA